MELHTLDCSVIPDDAGDSYPCDCKASEIIREAQEVAWAKGATSAGMNLTALQAAGINPNPYRKDN